MTAEKKANLTRILLVVLCVLCAGTLALCLWTLWFAKFLESEVCYLERTVAQMREEATMAEQSSETDPFADITAPAEQSAAETDPAARALYESQCQTVSYDQLNRAGNTAIRQYYTFTGKILQVMDSSYRLGVGADYSDVIYLEYVLPAGAERLLEDDFVTVWGQSLGLYTYTTVSEREVTVPRLTVGYLDRLSSEELAAQSAAQYTVYEIGETQNYRGCTVTLDKVMMRPAKEGDDVTSTEGKVVLFFLFDIMNSGSEEVEFGKYVLSAWVDRYPEYFLYAAADPPNGYQQLSYETVEPGYGIRGYLTVCADADFSEAELRNTYNTDDGVLKFVFSPEAE